MLLLQPIYDAGAAPQAIVAMKGGKWFVAARYPASAGLFDGLYHGEFAASPEEAVENWVKWLDAQWDGL